MTAAETEALRRDITRHDTEFTSLWDALEKMGDRFRNRLPTWATFLIASLTGIIGWLLKLATIPVVNAAISSSGGP